MKCCSRSRWLGHLDEPEPFVDASGDLGEERSCIGVPEIAHLRAGIACMSPKVAQCRRKRLAVSGTRRAIPVECRPPCDRLCCSLGLAPKLHDALGDQVRIL